MAQLAKPNADAALRTYLIELRTELRALFTNTLLDAGPDWARYVWTECSKGVDPLIAGEAVEVRRFELPDDHQLAAGRIGHPCDSLELTSDDVLRPDS